VSITKEIFTAIIVMIYFTSNPYTVVSWKYFADFRGERNFPSDNHREGVT